MDFKAKIVDCDEPNPPFLLFEVIKLIDFLAFSLNSTLFIQAITPKAATSTFKFVPWDLVTEVEEFVISPYSF